MFAELNARMNVALFYLVTHSTKSVAVLSRLQSLAFALARLNVAMALFPMAGPTPTGCNTSDVLSALTTGLTSIINILTGLGIAAGVVGIAVGGLMRATSFGNERRIAMSNTAITCAVIGLVIVILSLTIGNDLPTWLGMGGSSCQVTPNVSAPTP